MKSMILADSRTCTDDSSAFGYRKSKLRLADEVCYDWSHSSVIEISPSPASLQSDAWKVAKAVASSLNLPLELAGVLHFVVDEFGKDSCRCKFVPGVDCVSIMFAVIEPFIRGFRYITLTDCKPDVIRKLSSQAGFGPYPIGWVDSQSSSDSSVNSSLMQDCEAELTGSEQIRQVNKKIRSSNASCSCGMMNTQVQSSLLSLLNSRIMNEGTSPVAAFVDPNYYFQIRCVAMKAMALYYLAVSESKSFSIHGDWNPAGSSAGPNCASGVLSKQYSVCRTPWELGLQRCYADVDLDLFGKEASYANHMMMPS